jgi:hypothetical protein
VILHGISLPPSREEIGEDTAKRVPKDERTYFTPDILSSELMWTALITLILTAGSLWFWDAPLESHADPVVTPLHVVAPWYLSWSQGWLKLAPKTIVVGFIPLLLVAFIVMPYFEVGKSRRYADRRVGLSVAFLFMAFMLVSNWMGSPEFRVESSPEREVSQAVLPQEGSSYLKGVPYEFLVPGSYIPGQIVEDNPHLTRALQVFQDAMYRQSCTLNGNPDLPYDWYPCTEEVLENGTIVYGNHFTDNAMPDPYAELRITQEQDNMVRLTLIYEVVDPQNPEEFLILSDEAVSFRHEDSLYEEECLFLNKNC